MKSQKQNRKLLVVGDATVDKTLRGLTFGSVIHHYENLMDLMYDRPDDDYDAAVVGCRENERDASDVVKYLSWYFKSMPIFIIKVKNAATRSTAWKATQSMLPANEELSLTVAS